MISEKNNKDVDGRQFKNRISDLYHVNTVGHQFVMDDHPDTQHMRLRTSAGNQILLNDSCTNPYIYMQTATGNVWIEMSDSGSINIYAGGDINMHSEGDYNLSVDGDMNVGIKGNLHTDIGGTVFQNVGGIAQYSYESDVLISNSGEYDLITGGDSRIEYGGDFHTRVAGGEYLSVVGLGQHDYIGRLTITSVGVDINSSDTISITTPNDFELISQNSLKMIGNIISIGSYTTMNLNTTEGMFIDSQNIINITAPNGNVSLESGGGVDIRGTNNINLNSDAQIHFNSPAPNAAASNITTMDMPASTLTAPFHLPVAIPARVFARPPYRITGAPSDSEIVSGKQPQFMDSTVPGCSPTPTLEWSLWNGHRWGLMVKYLIPQQVQPHVGTCFAQTLSLLLPARIKLLDCFKPSPRELAHHSCMH